MRLQPSRLAILAAAALSLSTAAIAVAQEGPPPPGPPPMADDGPPMMHRHRMDPEARAQHLRDVLQLRSDQDGALKAYLAAIEPKDRADWKRDDEDGPKAPLTTPQRLDREAEHMARAAEAFKARAAATRSFYAALSPSQQKAFDALGPMLGGHGPMMRRIEVRRMKGGPDGAPPMLGKRKAG
ncbi:Protein of unknown function (DUF1520) [Caulobacter sp. AP07]|uniref:Spy/CpxP family protein refolding chaperone n=1 Tax=Caulobacter sp. AP07 TaxID=1144304 RepID=UPI00027225A0|nr:Spy/CpxP family protein refolding chaperone [Caulobacter sp. AP07]EJL24610.1 Protein of unknown function (DUF1520) [Caulobacter sp. AP07]